MKFVITGATSFIGLELIDYLLAHNHSVVAVCRQDSKGLSFIPHEVEIVVSKMCDYGRLCDAIPKADVCAYVSSDNVEWTQIKVAFVKPKTVAQGWRLFEAVPTKVLPEGTKYIKFELQVLNIEDLGNCFVTGFQKVELFTEIDDSMNINTADDENEDAANDENNETNSDNSSNLADSNFNNANKGISITTLYIFLGVAFVVMIASCVVTSTIINKKNK